MVVSVPKDRRFVTAQRYLRRIYVDPMTGKAEWDLIAGPGGGFMGVQSLSTKRAIRRLEDQETAYKDWKFAYEPPEVLRRTSSRSPPGYPAQSNGVTLRH